MIGKRHAHTRSQSATAVHIELIALYSMIRKSGNRFSSRQTLGVCAEIMLNKRLEHVALPCDRNML
jgi:hypothetical protein